jgi:hypothetical protein
MSKNKKTRVKKRGTTSKKHPESRLLAFRVGEGPVNVAKFSKEVQEMTDVLLGRVEPPINEGAMTLLTVADAYFARGSEMAMQIHRAERQGVIDNKSPAYRFRTGELDKFLTMAKRRGDKGSRDITYRGQLIEAMKTGRADHNPEYED